MIELELTSVFRILLAGICGTIVGIERKNRSKEAGIRTHCVVACGAAIIMIVSKYAFFDIDKIATFINFGSEIKFDPSRVASTIASGIGFLGAGMIFVQKNTITGLTTAAGVWATSGIGMAIGSGLYIVGISATFIIVIAQVILHIDFHRTRGLRTKRLSIMNVDEQTLQSRVQRYFNDNNIKVLNIMIENDDKNMRNYTFMIELPEEILEDEIITFINHKCSIKSC